MGTNFRSAWNGFNRSDVVNYMEECAANYERSLRQLQNENARLRAELDEARAVQNVPPAPEPVPEPVPLPAPPPAPAPAGEELEAYRRAEAVEREARQRAQRLGGQMQAIIESVVKQFDTADADVESLMSDLSICLRRLNDTFANLRLTFEGTSQAFHELK